MGAATRTRLEALEAELDEQRRVNAELRAFLRVVGRAAVELGAIPALDDGVSVEGAHGRSDVGSERAGI